MTYSDKLFHIMRKKIVSYSQFANFWSCPNRWRLNYIEKLKTFEDSIHMSFGTAIHEALQSFLTTYYNVSEEAAYKMDLITPFIAKFKQQVTMKGIKHTQAEFNEFVEDGKGIIAEFIDPNNIKLRFHRDKYELVGIEVKFISPIVNNVNLDARLNLVLREKLSGDIHIIDIKTATRAWDANTKEDFTKTSQLILYKAVYSKKENIPLSKIHVEFIILRTKALRRVQLRTKPNPNRQAPGIPRQRVASHQGVSWVRGIQTSPPMDSIRWMPATPSSPERIKRIASGVSTKRTASVMPWPSLPLET